MSFPLMACFLVITQSRFPGCIVPLAQQKDIISLRSLLHSRAQNQKQLAAILEERR
jgi:hypothetical protein